MFAFALWDRPRRRLLIGRDRLGIKPLYYHEGGGRLWFASEAKAILAALERTPEIDPVALHEYLALGYPPAPVSMFKGIRKLPPGSSLVCEGGAVRIERYWGLPAGADGALGESEWADAFLRTVEQAVVSQMVSDVPLGGFLSGGIDSSTIVALMARNSSKPVKTYAIGFENAGAGGYYDELQWARQVAARYGTEHHEIIVKPDVAQLLPKLLWHLDEPVADSALITTFLVAEFARRDVTVILSGVGGDELFGGYHRYLGPYYDRYYDLLPGWLHRHLLVPVARALPSDRHSAALNLARHLRTYVLSRGEIPEERYRTYVQVFGRAALQDVLRVPPRDAVDALGIAFRHADGNDLLTAMGRVDLLTQLPDDLLLLTDKMTMATSLECRVPFLDNTVLDLSLRMPSRLKVRGRCLKYIMKQALGGILPPEILFRGKRGFGAPVGAWFKAELAPVVRRVLSRESVVGRGLLRWEAVERTVSLHAAGREDHTDHLLALVNLELWCRLYLDGRSAGDVTAELQEGM